MKTKRNIILISTLCVSASSIAAEKLVQIGEPITNSVPLVFKTPGNIRMKLNASDSHKAGKLTNDFTLVNYEIDTDTLSRIGVRFSPNMGKSMGTGKMKLTGTSNNPTHTLTLKLQSTDPHVMSGDWIVSRDDLIMYFGSVKLNGDQVVQADTYIVSLDAAVFTS